MYEIEFTPASLDDLRWFRRYEQNIILDAIRTQLAHEPMVETNNRFRRDPPDIAEWELRIGIYRVFYSIEEFVRIVRIERIGAKPNNTVFLRGQRGT